MSDARNVTQDLTPGGKKVGSINSMTSFVDEVPAPLTSAGCPLTPILCAIDMLTHQHEGVLLTSFRDDLSRRGRYSAQQLDEEEFHDNDRHGRGLSLQYLVPPDGLRY